MKHFLVMATAIAVGIISAQLGNYAFAYGKTYYTCVYKAPAMVKQLYGVDVIAEWKDDQCILIPTTKP